MKLVVNFNEKTGEMNIDVSEHENLRKENKLAAFMVILTELMENGFEKILKDEKVSKRHLTRNIQQLESSGYEIINMNTQILRDGTILMLLMAQQETDTQKQTDKSIYEKMYLLEKYCEKTLCTKCKIYAMCDEYIGDRFAHWGFNDVEEAYEVIKNDR